MMRDGWEIWGREGGTEGSLDFGGGGWRVGGLEV